MPNTSALKASIDAKAQSGKKESTGYVMQFEVVPDAFATRAVQVIGFQ